MKKAVSLNRMIVKAMISAFTVILILLLSFNFYLMKKYQNTIRANWNYNLDKYTLLIENNLDEINADLYDVCNYDTSFKNLQKLSETACYSDAYSLYKRLETTQIFSGKKNDFILYYNGMKSRKYSFDQGKLSSSSIEDIKAKTESLLLNNEDVRNRYFLELCDEPVVVYIYQIENVALCEIYNLNTIARNLEKEFSEKNVVAFYTYNGKILKGETQDREIAPEQYYIISREIEETGLTINVGIPKNIWIYISIQQIFLVLLSILVVVGEIVFYNRLQRELLNPMERMQQDLLKVASGEIESQIETQTNLIELRQVIDAVNYTIGEVEKQKMISYEREIEAQKSQMQFLSLQLKPHFYLNGLKTLNVLAIDGNTKKIRDIIFRISEHLRYLLQVDRNVVELESEIQYVNNYRDLQQDMTDRPITINWNVDEGLGGWMVPTLCIQTFVENSFKYAKVGSAGSELVIDINIVELETEDGRFLDIYIRDNGQGYPQEVLDIINGEPVESSRCIGINNLIKRCQLLYGSWSEYFFDSDCGAASGLILPKIKD